MEKQILDLLMEMKENISKMNERMSKMDERLSNIEKEQQEIKQDINDRFDVVDIKLNALETRVIKIDRKLDSTTNQVARNMEVVEDIKLKLQ